MQISISTQTSNSNKSNDIIRKLVFYIIQTPLINISEKTLLRWLGLLELLSVRKYKNFCPCSYFYFEGLVKHFWPKGIRRYDYSKLSIRILRIYKEYVLILTLYQVEILNYIFAFYYTLSY